MSQASNWGVPSSPPATPTSYATRDNQAFNALLSMHSGASAPSYATQGTQWMKTGAALLPVFINDGAQDVQIGAIDSGTHQFFLSLAAAADGLGIFFETRATAAAHSGDIPSTVSTVYVQRFATGRPWAVARYKRGTSGGVKPLLIGDEYWELDLSGANPVNAFWFDVQENGADATTELGVMIAAGVAAANLVFDFQNRVANFVGPLTLSADCVLLNFNGVGISNKAQIQNYILVDQRCAVYGKLSGVGVQGAFSCRVVATTNVNLSGGGLAAGQSVDSVTLATNDIVLVTGQTTASQNGVYVVPSSGAASRHSSFNTYDSHAGKIFKVLEGTTYGVTPWICTSATGGTLGTTAISIVFRTERGIYPAVNGACDVQLGRAGELLKLSNLTIAAQAAYISGTDPAPDSSKCKRWVNHLDLSGIFGQQSGSGYGLLMVTCEKFFNLIQARGVGRHVLYHSAGTSFCDSIVHVENCQYESVVFNAFTSPVGSQEPNRHNRAWVTAKNILATRTDSFVVDLSGGSNDNEVHVKVEGSSDIGGAVLINGVGTTAGPHPTGNKLHIDASGHFIGSNIVSQLNGETTEIIAPHFNVIVDGASPALIRVDKNSGNTASTHVECSVHGGYMNGQSVAGCVGVLIAATNGGVDVFGGTRFELLASKVTDSAGKRSGLRCRQAVIQANINSVPNGSSLDQTVTLNEAFENIKIIPTLLSASVNSANIAARNAGNTSNTATVRVVNNSGADADTTVAVLVTGD